MAKHAKRSHKTHSRRYRKKARKATRKFTYKVTRALMRIDLKSKVDYLYAYASASNIAYYQAIGIGHGCCWTTFDVTNSGGVIPPYGENNTGWAIANQGINGAPNNWANLPAFPIRQGAKYYRRSLYLFGAVLLGAVNTNTGAILNYSIAAASLTAGLFMYVPYRISFVTAAKGCDDLDVVGQLAIQNAFDINSTWNPSIIMTMKEQYGFLGYSGGMKQVHKVKIFLRGKSFATNLMLPTSNAGVIQAYPDRKKIWVVFQWLQPGTGQANISLIPFFDVTMRCKFVNTT